MKIKRAGLNDLPEILELQKKCYIEVGKRYNDFNILPLTQTLKDIENEFSKSIFFKVEEEGLIVGSIRGYKENNSCFIGRLIVKPEFQNKGIGTSLLKEIEGHFEDVPRYELFTGNEDVKNLYLYKKNNYVEFKSVSVNNQLTMVFLEKIKQENNKN